VVRGGRQYWGTALDNEPATGLAEFGLELAGEKTKVISFSRFRKWEKTSFEFLGFEFRWGKFSGQRKWFYLF
jgi:hypothetical protein